MNADSTRQPLERRALGDDAQLTTTDDHGQLMLGGYAVRFGSPSEPLVGKDGATFVEVIERQALSRLAERRDCKALVGHDASRVVGSTKAGTLTLTVDDVGLRFRLHPPNSPDGHSLVEAVKRHDLDGVSIGFRALRDEWRTGSPPVRRLTDIDLFEVSFVCWPAYREAGVQIEARALQHAAQLAAHYGQEQRASELDALGQRLTALLQGRPSR